MDNCDSRESYKLLELSEKSDSELDLPDFISVPKKKKIRRKIKKQRTHSIQSSSCTCNVWVITVWIATILLTTWIISLTWLAIMFHKELQRLDSSYKQVVASSQGVPDALQKCHTVTKDLQQNQTIILGQITDLKIHMENLSRDVASVQSELNKIQQKLSNAPEYVNIPQQISEVSGSVANLGSQIKDLTTTVTTLKDFKNNIEVATNTLKNNVTDIRQSLTRLQNISQVKVVADNKSNVEIENIMKNLDEIKANVTNINSTLTNRLQWLMEDQKRDHKTVDFLSETGQNMSARITTLEGICNKLSSDEITLRIDVNNVSKEVKSLTTKVQGISMQLPLIQSQYRQINISYTDLQKKINSLLHSPVMNSEITSPSHLSQPTLSTPYQSDQEQTNKLVTSPISINSIQQTTQSGTIGKPDVLEIKKDSK